MKLFLSTMLKITIKQPFQGICSCRFRKKCKEGIILEQKTGRRKESTAANMHYRASYTVVNVGSFSEELRGKPGGHLITNGDVQPN